MVLGDPDRGTHGVSIITSETSIKLLSCSYEFSMPGEEVGAAQQVFTEEGSRHLPLLRPFKGKCVIFRYHPHVC